MANGIKKGSDITVEPIRKQKDIKAINRFLKFRPRYHLLFILGYRLFLRLSSAQISAILWAAIRRLRGQVVGVSVVME